MSSGAALVYDTNDMHLPTLWIAQNKKNVGAVVSSGTRAMGTNTYLSVITVLKVVKNKECLLSEVLALY